MNGAKRKNKETSRVALKYRIEIDEGTMTNRSKTELHYFVESTMDRKIQGINGIE